MIMIVKTTYNDQVVEYMYGYQLVGRWQVHFILLF